ncbi:TIGR02391 family protein [Streptomyces sp. NPDC005065]|uniref:TIGR02391 family protein n=1 Tax=Streptomyces sp. NPDC005065 TaxID=3154461 RepID=UPI0033AB610C
MPRPTGDEGHVLLDAIWAYFSEHHRWPAFDDIDRKLYAKGLDFEEVVQQLCPALLRGVSSHGGLLPMGGDELSLTIAGAANATGTESVISVFLGMVRTAASIEPHYVPKEPGEYPQLRPRDLRSVDTIDVGSLTDEVMYAAAKLGLYEPCFRGSNFNPVAEQWTSLTFDRRIRPFADVHRLDDYWRIREQVLGAERTETDNRAFGQPPTLHTDPVTTPAPAAPAAGFPEPMSVTCNLHPLIAEVADERYNRGAYNDAVRSAFQAVEHRVHTLVGDSSAVGDRLMGIAFNAKPGPPMITVTRSTGGSLESEQTGMQFLFKGAMGALRNPRSHGPDDKDDRDEAEEMLVFASFLMRRLDIEYDKRKADGSGS